MLSRINNAVRWELARYTRGRGLHVGCGEEKYYPQFIGVDCAAGGMADMVVPDLGRLDVYADACMDFVVTSGRLADIAADSRAAALVEWFRVLRVGGHLALYESAEVTEASVEAALHYGFNFVHSEVIDDARLMVFRKEPAGRSYDCRIEKPTKTCAVLRFGAFGDSVQSSSILPQLKKMGYHITYITQPRGYEVIKHEPLVDEFILLDPDQIPNPWLGTYFEHLNTRYDKVVNLSESVEGTFLAVPGRTLWYWPTQARHAVMDRNYTEIAHAVAGIRYTKPEMRFVATAQEQAWARATLDAIGGWPKILWVLAGSSFHKMWPHMDAVIARVLLRWPGAQIIFSGDEWCKVLEKPWVNEKRVHCKSAEWSIRESLAVAQQCDIVVGPETGIMSAVAMLPMPKVVLLSHSSVENLTKDWHNTYSVYSMKTPCWPCHRMIREIAHCEARDKETGAAQCQADIPADAVWHAMLAALEPEKSHKRRAA